MKSFLKIFTLVGMAFLVATHGYACTGDDVPLEDVLTKKGTEISGPITVENLEKENMIKNRETGKVLPFGYANEFWIKFKSKVKPGDMIYFYKFSEKGFYQDGHILVRDKCIIDFLGGAVS